MKVTETDLGIYFENESFLCFFGRKESSYENLKRAFPSFQLKRVKQVHGDLCVNTTLQSEDLKVEADAHWTKDKNLSLIIATADCIPVMIYCSHSQMVCAIHAGWRGIANRIIPKTFKKLVDEGAKASHLGIMIGPHIQYASFEVGADVKDLLLRSHSGFSEDWLKQEVGSFWKKSTVEEKYLVDLHLLAMEQIQELAVQPDQIQSYFIDTMTDSSFHSYRRDKDKSGRQLSFISLV